MKRKTGSLAIAKRQLLVQRSTSCAVGEALREVYGHVLAEPVPDSLRHIISKLREEERRQK